MSAERCQPIRFRPGRRGPSARNLRVGGNVLAVRWGATRLDQPVREARIGALVSPRLDRRYALACVEFTSDPTRSCRVPTSDRSDAPRPRVVPGNPMLVPECSGHPLRLEVRRCIEATGHRGNGPAGRPSRALCQARRVWRGPSGPRSRACRDPAGRDAGEHENETNHHGRIPQRVVVRKAWDASGIRPFGVCERRWAGCVGRWRRG